MTQIILISGGQGAGKTTLANALLKCARQAGFFSHILKFADPLYRIHHAVLETASVVLNIPKVEKDGDLLQLLGTEWARKKFGPNVWADALKLEIEKVRRLVPENFSLLIIVDDCRFENEFDAFPDAVTIRLEVPEEIRRKRCESWRENTLHPSETGLDAYAKAGKFMHYFFGSRTPDDMAKYVLNKLEQDRKDNFDLWGNRK